MASIMIPLDLTTVTITQQEVVVVVNSTNLSDLTTVTITQQEVVVVAFRTVVIPLDCPIVSLNTLNPEKVGGVVNSLLNIDIATLRLTGLNIQEPISIGVPIQDAPTIRTVCNILPTNVVVNAHCNVLQLTQHSSVVQLNDYEYINKRVIQIGNIIIQPSMYWSDNINPFVSTSEVTEGGETIHFMIRLRPFTINQTISSQDTMSFDYLTTLKLQQQINEDMVLLHFNDGSHVYAKFDLLGQAFKATPIFEGSDRYYIEIKVLV